MKKFVGWCIDNKYEFYVADRSENNPISWKQVKGLEEKILQAKYPFKTMIDVLKEKDECDRRIYITLPDALYQRRGCKDSWEASEVELYFYKKGIYAESVNNFGIPYPYECVFCDVIESCPAFKIEKDGSDGKSSEEFARKARKFVENLRKKGDLIHTKIQYKWMGMHILG